MHPILVQFGHFFIGTYGFFVAAGLLIGLFAASKLAKRHGVDPNLITDIVFLGVVLGILGARITYILVNFGDFSSTFSDPNRSPMEYILSRQGFVFGGGIILAIAGSVLYIRRKKQRLWLVADVFAPAMPLGHAIGRIGCFFAGCCWGKVCSLPWAVRYPNTIGPNGEELGFAFQQQVMKGWIPETAHLTKPIHPVQLYESAALFVLAALLSYAWRKRRFEGQIFLLYLMGYPIIRFLDEFLRGDDDRGFYGWFSVSQYLSIGAFVIGIVLWVVLRHRKVAINETTFEDASAQSPATEMAVSGEKRRRKR